ncbi:protein kinase domain-containing protein [Legionella shakespearei]|uniref:Protein kinase domain protein n=1 Tax=Legionella shakespearei DSM 23087 TaxID=1122169 RepID=A0A0W0YPU7_9GAMM|nr:protein kinase [Legionella shakespearei]KTD58881.1 Protein kinase domain protein [Legionella shakespearei DSM 23087]
MKNYADLIASLNQKNLFDDLNEFSADNPQWMEITPEQSGEPHILHAFKQNGEIQLISYEYNEPGNSVHLGSGTQASIYAAVNLKTGQKLALKIHDLRDAEDSESRNARKEALLNGNKQAYTVQNQVPALIHTYAYGLSPDGTKVMMLMERGGMSVEKWVATQTPTFDQKVNLVVQIVALVTALQKANVRHGDLTFWNLLVNERGQLKLCDIDTMQPIQSSDRSEIAAVNGLIYALFVGRMAAFGFEGNPYSNSKRLEYKTINLLEKIQWQGIKQVQYSVRAIHSDLKVYPPLNQTQITTRLHSIDSYLNDVTANAISVYRGLLITWWKNKSSQSIYLGNDILNKKIYVEPKELLEHLTDIYSHPLILDTILAEKKTWDNRDMVSALYQLSCELKKSHSPVYEKITAALKRNAGTLLQQIQYQAGEFDFAADDNPQEVFRLISAMDVNKKKAALEQLADNKEGDAFSNFSDYLFRENALSRQRSMKDSKIVDLQCLFDVALQKNKPIDMQLIDILFADALKNDEGRAIKLIEMFPYLVSFSLINSAIYHHRNNLVNACIDHNNLDKQLILASAFQALRYNNSESHVQGLKLLLLCDAQEVNQYINRNEMSKAEIGMFKERLMGAVKNYAIDRPDLNDQCELYKAVCDKKGAVGRIMNTMTGTFQFTLSFNYNTTRPMQELESAYENLQGRVGSSLPLS